VVALGAVDPRSALPKPGLADVAAAGVLSVMTPVACFDLAKFEA
jgi:hypothetical protein